MMTKFHFRLVEALSLIARAKIFPILNRSVRPQRSLPSNEGDGGFVAPNLGGASNTAMIHQHQIETLEEGARHVRSHTIGLRHTTDAGPSYHRAHSKTLECGRRRGGHRLIGLVSAGVGRASCLSRHQRWAPRSAAESFKKVEGAIGDRPAQISNQPRTDRLRMFITLQLRGDLDEREWVHTIREWPAAAGRHGQRQIHDRRGISSLRFR